MDPPYPFSERTGRGCKGPASVRQGYKSQHPSENLERYVIFTSKVRDFHRFVALASSLLGTTLSHDIGRHQRPESDNVEFNPPRFGLGGSDIASLTLHYAGPDVVEVGDQPLRTCALLIHRLHTYSCTVKTVMSMESRQVEQVNKLAVHVSC